MNSERPHSKSAPKGRKPLAKAGAKAVARPAPPKPAARKPTGTAAPRRAKAQPKEAELDAIYQQGLRDWREQVDYFHTIYDALCQDPKTRGKYVAIKDKKLIAVDNDHWRLRKEMYRKHPKDYVLVIRVAPAPTIEVRGFELAWEAI